MTTRRQILAWAALMGGAAAVNTAIPNPSALDFAERMRYERTRPPRKEEPRNRCVRVIIATPNDSAVDLAAAPLQHVTSVIEKLRNQAKTARDLEWRIDPEIMQRKLPVTEAEVVAKGNAFYELISGEITKNPPDPRNTVLYLVYYFGKDRVEYQDLNNDGKIQNDSIEQPWGGVASFPVALVRAGDGRTFDPEYWSDPVENPTAYTAAGVSNHEIDHLIGYSHAAMAASGFPHAVHDNGLRPATESLYMAAPTNPLLGDPHAEQKLLALWDVEREDLGNMVTGTTSEFYVGGESSGEYAYAMEFENGLLFTGPVGSFSIVGSTFHTWKAVGGFEGYGIPLSNRVLGLNADGEPAYAQKFQHRTSFRLHRDLVTEWNPSVDRIPSGNPTRPLTPTVLSPADAFVLN